MATKLARREWFLALRHTAPRRHLHFSTRTLSRQSTLFSQRRQSQLATKIQHRSFFVSHKKLSASDDVREQERESDNVDVCIVGGGPAGLAAAIRLKQLANEAGNEEFRVLVLEKAGELGDHIVSGNVLEPSTLDQLLPD